MKHNVRCENSERGKKYCKCTVCNGDLHGRAAKERLYSKSQTAADFDEVRIDESFGGEVEKFIRGARGKEYRCFGTHPHRKNEYRIMPDEFIHTATEFFAYPHDGGLADKFGTKWWVFVKCDNPMPFHGHTINEVPRYETSFAHFPGQVEAAARERDIETQFENAEEMRMDGIRAEEDAPWERDY